MLPKFPFSLFDFKNIDRIEPIFKRLNAAAGDAITTTTIYEVPQHKFALLLGVGLVVTKTTATELNLHILRNFKIGASKTFADYLLTEDVATSKIGWPSAKTAADHTLGWHLCFMWAEDQLRVSHALTAAEVIQHDITINRIEYSDPRFKE